MNDACPHRFAPLHLGKRTGDTVACPDHGLAFGLNPLLRAGDAGAVRARRILARKIAEEQAAAGAMTTA